MDLETLLTETGGLVTWSQLGQALGRSGARRAVRTGAVVRVGHGRYAAPEVAGAARVAHAVKGHLSHTSAALHHGWEVLHAPEKPHVVFPRRRRLHPDARAQVQQHWADLAADQVTGCATTQQVTLHHCLTGLPFLEALAVADSALRHGVTPSTLHRVAAEAAGNPGARQARRVAGLARAEADNPFESALRGVADDVPGLAVRPQVTLRTRRGTVRPDLVDLDLGLVLEADSFRWHGSRAALRRDCRRYNDLVVCGWRVLRFPWEDVVLEPEHVRAVLAAAVAEARARTKRPRRVRRAA